MTQFFSDLYITLFNMRRLPFNLRKFHHQVYTILAILFAIALLPFPYSYYIFLRTIVCIALYFYWAALYPMKQIYAFWYYGVIGLAVLYNPIFTIELDSQFSWFIINIGTLYFLYRIRLILNEAGF